MHTDDPLYHAIIANHHDRDRNAVRHRAQRPSGGKRRHDLAPASRSGLGIVSPVRLDIPSLIARPFAALTSLAAMAVRPFPFLRVRSTAPCCAADCG